MEIVKRAGFDWTIEYEDDEGVHEMTVFGAMTIEEACSDARSFMADDAIAIIRAVRK